MRYYFSQLIILLLFVSFLFVPKITYSQTATCECSVNIEAAWCSISLNKDITDNVQLEDLLKSYSDYSITNKPGTGPKDQCNNKAPYVIDVLLDLYSVGHKKQINGGELDINPNYVLDLSVPETCNFSVSDNFYNGTQNINYNITCSSVPAPPTPAPKIVCKSFDNNQTECQKTENNNACFWIKDKKSCVNKDDSDACGKVKKEDDCKNQMTACTFENNTCKPKAPVAGSSNADNVIKETHGVPTGYKGPIPDCAFTDECRDINVLLEMVVKIVEVIFGFIAGLALVFFVYGGFTMMLSFGSSEKVKKGQQVLVAAVVGLIIVFSAYILIDFLLDALGVVEGFRGIDLK